MARRPNLKLIEKSMSETELPATQPILLASAEKRAGWQRELNTALDEREYVDMQIKSADRVRDTVMSEAACIRDAAINLASSVYSSILAETDSAHAAKIEGLTARRDDLTSIITDLSSILSPQQAGCNDPDQKSGA